MSTFWYILHIYSGHEKKVKLNLEQRAIALQLDNFLTQVVIPLKEFTEIKDGKRQTVERPSFPGYILIETQKEIQSDSEDKDIRNCWALIQDTPSVMGFVGGGGPKPNTLSPEEVSTILDAPAEQEEDIGVIDYIPGDQVRVIEGPFRGFVAEVNRVDVDKRRLHLNISIFGRVTPFDLEFFEVEKLE